MTPTIRLAFIEAANEKEFARRFRQFSKNSDFVHLIKSGYREAGFKVDWNGLVYYSIRMNHTDENSMRFFLEVSRANGYAFLRFENGTFSESDGKPIPLEPAAIEPY